MKTLEETLEEIKEAEEGLHAEVVLQEEEGYEEEIEHYPGSRYGTCDYCEVIKEWRVTQERIAEPDHAKRKESMAKLDHAYVSFEWYSARYQAGKAMDIPIEYLEERADKWIDKLSSEMELPTINKIKTGEHEEVDDDGYYIDFAGKPRQGWAQTRRVEDFKEEPIPENIARITKAKEDLNGLYNIVSTEHNLNRISRLLEKDPAVLFSARLSRGMVSREEIVSTYKRDENFIYSDDVVKIAGKALGYSGPRVWARLNPVKAALGFAASSGTIIGAAYAFAEYLAK